MHLVARLSKKQGDAQIALNSVFLSHQGFRLKHIDNFYVRIFFEPLIYLQLPWWINIGSTIAEGKAVVLIDEIELHLHPLWQRQILSRLKKIFSNCQFVATTHYPLVLGEVEARCI